MRLLIILGVLSTFLNWWNAERYLATIYACDRQRDSLALVDLYNSTGGENWVTTWDLNVPIEEWFGLKVNEEGCVECLNLSGGVRCSSIGNTGNNLVGEIPAALGQLSNLEILSLSSNNLSGAIPAELGRLSNLTSLYLNDNKLNNAMSTELKQLSNLEVLSLNNNMLSGEIPTELNQLSNLEVLSLNNNHLSGEIPVGLEQLSNLEVLGLNNNDLSGSIPAELEQLSNLVSLNLSNNDLSGAIPVELGQISDLEVLGLSNNDLSGAIPVELEQLLNLVSLNLSNNNLSDVISTGLGQLSNLVTLNLSSNNLNGEIPMELAQLSNLTSLYLNDNQLSGCYDNILDVFCNLRAVDEISFQAGYDFKNNPSLPWQGDFEHYCNGELQIGASCDDNNETTQNDIIISNCGCVGALPNPCRERDSLALVAFHNNTGGENWTITWDLNMPMDTWFGLKVNEEGCVITLILSSNNLSGEIPPEVGKLLNLTSLRLYRNELSGAIPVELGKLLNLVELNLNGNQLSGEIPSELGALSNLVDFNLGSNKLQGEIPFELGQLNMLNWLQIYDNDLSGVIPPELGQLSNLTNIWLQDNDLSGVIPVELGQLSNLRRLNLKNNQLSGCYQEGLLTLCNIQYNFLNNPLLPWQGDFEHYCNGEDQFGVFCDDDNSITDNDTITVTCGCFGACSQSDSLALVALYNNTGGENWTITWDLNTSIETWYGVELSEEGCVTKLLLINNNLVGGIPSELGQLFSLKKLDFSANQLSTCYDSVLDVFCDLGAVDESPFNEGYNFKNNPLLPWQGDFERYCNGESQISAPCDDENHGTQNDVITADCDCIGILTNPCRERDSLALVALYNSAGGENWITTWDLNMPMDTWFGVSVNGEGCVATLNLINNNLSGLIPVELSKLSNLEILTFINNNLSGSIPAELGQLSNLEILVLISNNLNGSIPAELGQLSNLKILNLINNNLNGSIPAELGQLSNLEVLNLISNELSGTIPSELGDLLRLMSFDLNSNKLSGSIPRELGQLLELTSLNLNSNELSGSIPSELGGLLRLTSLNLNSNELNGLISSELGDLLRLTSLNLNSNKLSGSIPAELGQLSRLTSLNLNSNELSGSIPRELGQLLELRSFDINSNKLSGSIPRELGQLLELRSLNLNSNELSSSIPTELGQLSRLTSLNLNSNKLNGSIPTELGQLLNLTSLNLSSNELSGSIPTELGQLLNLRSLILSNNELSGAIPGELGQLLNLRSLILSNNELSGAIPGEVGQLSNLVELSFAGNELSDVIPVELRQLSNLKVLILSSNNLSGVIPTELGQLLNLTSLYLNDNNLSGVIPAELGRFLNLKYLWFQNNQLEGCFPEGLLSLCNINYNIKNNPLLPWQGDFERYCNGETQQGAPCDDGDPTTMDELITGVCNCNMFSLSIVDGETCGFSSFQVQLEGQGMSPYTCTWQRLGSTASFSSSNFSESIWTVPVLSGGVYDVTITDAENTLLRDFILVRDFPAANTMPNYHECEASTFITANLPEGTIGQWLGNSIEDPTGEESNVQLEYGENQFIWSLSKDECLDYSRDTLIIFREGHPTATKDAYCLSVAQDTLALPLTSNDDVSACSDYNIIFSDATIASRLTEAEKGSYHFQSERPNEVLEFEYTICNTVCPDFCTTESIYLEVVPTIGNVLAQPIGITPNGDGLNDMLIIKDLEINSYPQQELLIFNQWGQVIYQADPYRNNWEGRYENGQPVTEGTYYYILRLGIGEQARVGRVLVLR